MPTQTPVYQSLPIPQPQEVVSEQVTPLEPIAELKAVVYNPSINGSGYEPGQCTWFVAKQVLMPNNFHNAYEWARRAEAYGFEVSDVPKVGSVAQSSRGAGHVALVTEVDGDRVKIKEMNYHRAYGITERWVAVGLYTYIYF